MGVLSSRKAHGLPLAARSGKAWCRDRRRRESSAAASAASDGERGDQDPGLSLTGRADHFVAAVVCDQLFKPLSALLAMEVVEGHGLAHLMKDFMRTDAGSTGRLLPGAI